MAHYLKFNVRAFILKASCRKRENGTVDCKVCPRVEVCLLNEKKCEWQINLCLFSTQLIRAQGLL